MPCAVSPPVLLAEASPYVNEIFKNCGLCFCPSYYDIHYTLVLVQENTVVSRHIMETTHLKSLLKKPGQNKDNSKKRVTFCSTVKFYTDGSAPITAFLGSSSRHLSEIEKVDALVKTLNLECPSLSDAHNPVPAKWSEIDESSEVTFNTQTDDAEDFFVHKVVYDSQILLDENENSSCGQGENEDSGSGGYNFPEDDDDCEDFVVHQVIQDESDVQQESDADASGKEDSDGDVDIMKVKMPDNSLSTLSKKNIMHHNKRIEENIINENLQSILKFSQNTCVYNEPKLSPPLQELGIDKLTSDQPNSLLLRLDISPLNSVQESDTESNSSSEDTMIMMTSEECQKNEKHIRESFLQYQLLKQNKVFSLNDGCSKTDCIDNTHSSVSNKNADEPVACAENQPEPEEFETSDDLKNTEIVELVSPTEDHFLKENELTGVKNDILEVQIFSEQEVDSSDNGSQETPTDLISNNQGSVVSKDIKSPLPSLTSFTSGNSWGSCLSSVVIPSDVREWKITTNSDNACTGSQNVPTGMFTDSEESSLETSRSLPPMGTHNEYSNFPENKRTEAHMEFQKSEAPLICSSDELENFVSQSSERLDRIRRRYSLSEKAKFTLRDKVVRGIRPRFRPTSEILKQMQAPVHNNFPRFQSSINPMPWPRLGINQPKSIFFPEKRWSSPYFSSVTNEVSGCFVAGSSQHFSRCCAHGVDYSLYTVYASGKVTASHNAFFHKREKESSCAFSVLAERGIPEGASSETICEPVIPRHSPSSNEEGIVYFSMKV